MDDMSKQLGISKKTLYNHFTDKSELVEDIIKAKLTEDRMAFQKATENAINAIDELFMVSKFVIETFKSVNPTVFYDLKKNYPAEKNVHLILWVKQLELILV